MWNWVVDVKEKLEENLEETGTSGIEFLQFLKTGSEPEISMGTHCDLPYSCDFKEYCIKLKIEFWDSTLYPIELKNQLLMFLLNHCPNSNNTKITYLPI